MEYRPYQWQGEDHDSHVRYFEKRFHPHYQPAVGVLRLGETLAGERIWIDATTYSTTVSAERESTT
jgi:hypothetical protein